MACKGCAKRASRLLTWLGLERTVIGQADVTVWLFENPLVSVALRSSSVALHHTRAAILAIVLRVLYGRHVSAVGLTVKQVTFEGVMCGVHIHDYYKSRWDGMAITGGRLSSYEQVGDAPQTRVSVGTWMPLLGHYQLQPLDPPPPEIRDCRARKDHVQSLT